MDSDAQSEDWSHQILKNLVFICTTPLLAKEGIRPQLLGMEVLSQPSAPRDSCVVITLKRIRHTCGGHPSAPQNVVIRDSFAEKMTQKGSSRQRALRYPRHRWQDLGRKFLQQALLPSGVMYLWLSSTTFVVNRSRGANPMGWPHSALANQSVGIWSLLKKCGKRHWLETCRWHLAHLRQAPRTCACATVLHDVPTTSRNFYTLIQALGSQHRLVAKPGHSSGPASQLMNARLPSLPLAVPPTLHACSASKSESGRDDCQVRGLDVLARHLPADLARDPPLHPSRIESDILARQNCRGE